MSGQRWRKAGTYLLALLLVVGAGLWVASGEMFGDGAPEVRKAPAEMDEAASVPKVRVRQQTSEPRTHTITVQGRTAAERKVTIKAETGGRVVELLVDKGDNIEEGQLLARLAPEDRPARLKQAKARLAQRRAELNAARRLSEKGYRAETKLNEAEAEYEAAQAEVRQAEIELANTRILAPFAGVVGDRMVELGDYVGVGTEVLRLIDLDPIEVVGNVSERNVGLLTVGNPARADVVTGQSVEGAITFIAAEADETTRTFRVEMAASNTDFAVRDGVTAQLEMPVTQETAHFVSPSILTLSDEGKVGVKTVDAGNRVVFHEVDILADTPDGVWISGLPSTVTLITVGQNFVATGQQVDPVTETAVAESLQGTPLSLPQGAPGKPGPEARQ